MTEEDSLPRWMRVGDMIDFSRGLYPTWDDAYARGLCETLASIGRANCPNSPRASVHASDCSSRSLIARNCWSWMNRAVASIRLRAATSWKRSSERSTRRAERCLFSSHLLEEVDRVCDSIALMHQGRIIESTTIERMQSGLSRDRLPTGRAWDHPPKIEGGFAWKGSGGEWSAVCETARLDDPLFAGAAVDHASSATSR